MTTERPQIIIIGAGFGGLFAARKFADADVDVLLIDRNNYHTFTPLLYQVATAALDPSEIAYPVRTIFRDKRNIHFLLADVTAIDTEAQTVSMTAHDQIHQRHYDYLIVATGSTPTYFGNDEFREHSFELRTLRDAIRLRNHILSRFEAAVWTDDNAKRDALLTIVIVGGGPTGLETAGAVYELYNHVLNREYTREHLQARVILVEQAPNLLGPYPPKLQKAALEQLHSLGVETKLGEKVVAVHEDAIELESGERIDAYTLVWAAGVKAAPFADMLGVEAAGGGRIPVTPTMTVEGKQGVYVVGDLAYLEDDEGKPYPMLIPLAQQQGELAAENILAAIRGNAPTTFTYSDRGTMATIGRSRAVAWIFNRFSLTGLLAWWAWLGLHLLMLLGFRNRLNVFINWAWNYLTYDRAVRIIWARSDDRDLLP